MEEDRRDTSSLDREILDARATIIVCLEWLRGSLYRVRLIERCANPPVSGFYTEKAFHSLKECDNRGTFHFERERERCKRKRRTTSCGSASSLSFDIDKSTIVTSCELSGGVLFQKEYRRKSRVCLLARLLPTCLFEINFRNCITFRASKSEKTRSCLRETEVR